MTDLRIAWLLTSTFYYWHPMLSQLTRLFPNTMAFSANWQGYAPGFENSFQVDVVGTRKIIPIFKSQKDYGINFTLLPLNIVNRLLNFKPQVVFSNSFGMWTLLALLFKFLGQWRVVIAYEGSSPSIDCRNSPWRLTLRRWMVSLADACITNSQAGQQYLVDLLKASPERVFVHPYEVPDASSLLAQPSPTEPLLPEAPRLTAYPRPIFLYIGSLIPRKGIDRLLEACRLLTQQGHQTYSLVILGDGPERPTLETFCQTHQLSQQVHWLGKVPYHTLGQYLQQADVFVLPTREDTWGMVVLEAMLLGKPILCANQAGASELITDGHNGYRFDSQDVAQLANYMAQFIQTPALIPTMGQHSQQVMAQYTPAAAANFLKQVATFTLETA